MSTARRCISRRQMGLLLNMGVVLEQLGDLPAALERYEQVLRHHPGFIPALLNRGAVLIRLGRLQEALDNNRRLAELCPASEHALFNLGETLLAAGRWDEALDSCERALAINPGFAQARFTAGLALSMLRRFDRAQQEFQTARNLDPAVFDRCIDNAAKLAGDVLRDFSPRLICLLREAAELDVCDWSNWDRLVDGFAWLGDSGPDEVDGCGEPALAFRAFTLPVSGAASLALSGRIASRVKERVAAFPSFTHERPRGGRLRIGYISPDFRTHPTAVLTRRLYALHDRDRFEVYGYSLRPGDGSSLRRDIENGCDVFRELNGLDDRTAAGTIHRDGVDILIDLAGYTRFSRPEILAMRPAPLQVCYLGFPQTTGADFIDYFMADPVVIPPAARPFFSEEIAYLPDTYFLFDDRQEVSQRRFTRKELGLPENGFVFCCHNTSHKITPVDFDRWMNILKRVDASVLWLYRDSEVAAVNLRKEAAARGVDPARLVFAGRMANAEHLARYRVADLFLDTAICNAHTTAAEALWAGLPVLTCPGTTMASRVASSLLHAAGLDGMIAATPQEYEALACHFASHADELAGVRGRLAASRHSCTLFDTEGRVRQIETACLAMWSRHEAGLAPESFRVADRDGNA